MNRLKRLMSDVVRTMDANYAEGQTECGNAVIYVLSKFNAEYEPVEVTHYKEGCRDYLALPGDARFDECALPAPHTILIPREPEPTLLETSDTPETDALWAKGERDPLALAYAGLGMLERLAAAVKREPDNG